MGFLILEVGFLRGTGSKSLQSITTALDVRKALATEAECSRQHLTTCSNVQKLEYSNNSIIRESTIILFVKAYITAELTNVLLHISFGYY